MTDLNVGDLIARLRLDNQEFAKGVQESLGQARGLDANLARQKPKLGLDNKPFVDSLGQAQQRTGTFSNEAQRGFAGVGSSATLAGRNVDNASLMMRRNMGDFATSLSPIPLGMASIGLAAGGMSLAVGKFAMDSIGEFRQFDAMMKEVFTLLPGISQSAMTQMTEQVKSVALEMGVLPETVVPALYQALSAGVPPDNVFDFLRTANEAAVGGVSDLTTSVDGITTVVNAYTPAVISAGEASDKMFTTVKLGKTTFGELASSLSNVIPTAASLGVSFDNVMAAVARLTAQGVPTAQATTLIRAALDEAAKSGGNLDKALKELNGQSFTDLIASGQDIGTIFNDLRSSMPEEEFRNLFSSSEALRGVLGLTGDQAVNFKGALDEMARSQGASATAFETMESKGGRAVERLAAAWSILKIEVGEELSPVIDDLANGILENMPQITETVTGAAEAVSGFATKLAEIAGSHEVTVTITVVRRLMGEDGAETGIGELDWLLDQIMSPEGQFATDFSVDMATMQPGRDLIEPTIELAKESIQAAEDMGRAWNDVFSGLSDGMRGDFSGMSALWTNNAADARAWQEHVEESLRSVSGTSRDEYESMVAHLALVAEGERAYAAALNESRILAGEQAAGRMAEKAAIDQTIESLVGGAAALGDYHAEQSRSAAITLANQEHIRRLNMDTLDYVSTLSSSEQLMHAASTAMATLQTAQDQLSGAYQSGLSVMGQYNAQSSEYAGQASAVEKALEVLQKRQENGEQLSENEIQLLEQKDEILGRLNGGVDDATVAAGLAAAANSKLMQAQDELNRALQTGEIDQETYNQKLRDAQALYGDPSQADPLKGAMSDLSAIIGTDLVGSIDDLARMLEYISKPWLIEVDAAADAADSELARIVEMLDRINQGAYGMVAVDIMTTQQTQQGQAFAMGGYVSDPTLALIGEDGPELVLPLSKPNRMKQLLKEAGIQAYAQGGFIGGPHKTGGSGSPASGGDISTGISISVAVQPIDWGTLFEGIDPAAEDAAKRMSDVFIGFFSDIDSLVSGDTLAAAQKKVDDLFVVRQIAIDAGAGAEVIAGIDAQIAARQAEVDAIGFAMGTDIVRNMAAAAEASELAQQIMEGIKSDIGTFSLDGLISGDSLLDLESEVEDLKLLRQALIEAGVPAEALVGINDQIEEGERRIVLAGELIGTETVQHLIGLAEAAREAEAESKRLGAAVEMVANADGQGLGNLVASVKDLDAQIRLATMRGDWGLVESLTAERDEALAMLDTSGTLFFDALVSGLISDEQLYAMGQAGGENFIAFYESFFGEGTWEGFKDRYEEQIKYVINVEALKAHLGENEQLHEDYIDDIMAAYREGAISYEDALDLMTDATQKFTTDGARTMLDYYNETNSLLTEAIISGENLDEAQERYDKLMEFLTEYALMHGMTVEEVIAGWERIGAVQDKVIQGSTMMSMPTVETPAPPGLNDHLSTIVGFATTAQSLGSIIADAAAKLDEFDEDGKLAAAGIDKTQADEQLKLLQQIASNPELFPPGVLEHVLDQFAATLDDLGILEGSQLDWINGLLEAAGITAMDSLPEQLEAALIDSAETQGEIIGRHVAGALTADMHAATRFPNTASQTMQSAPAAASTLGPAAGGAGANPSSQGGGTLPPMHIEIPVYLGNGQLERVVVEVLDGVQRRTM